MKPSHNIPTKQQQHHQQLEAKSKQPGGGRANGGGGGSRQQHSTIMEEPALEEQDVTIEENEEEEEENDQQMDQQTDDQVNENLFSLYDNLFKQYNDFGSMFQQTAHQIGLLIRKNMIANHRIEELEEENIVLKTKNRETETSYETLLASITQKDKVTEEMINENAGLRLQLEQFIPKNMVSYHDIMKERGHQQQQHHHQQQHQQHQPTARQSKQNSAQKQNQGAPQAAAAVVTGAVAKEKAQAFLQQQQQQQQQKQEQQDHQQNLQVPNQRNYQPQKHANGAANGGGTFETFFDLNQRASHPDDLGSLAALFSNSNNASIKPMIVNDQPNNSSVSKKRATREEYQVNEESKKGEGMNSNTTIAAAGHSGQQKGEWLTNKRKLQRKQMDEDSQIAEKFDQLSEAFFNVGGNGNNPAGASNGVGRNNNSSQAAVPNKRSREGQVGIQPSQAQQNYNYNYGGTMNEDSASASSIINAAIRFDAQLARDNLRQQTNLNSIQGKSLQTENKQKEKSFDIKLVDPESQLDDFFRVKGQKNTRASAAAQNGQSASKKAAPVTRQLK